MSLKNATALKIVAQATIGPTLLSMVNVSKQTVKPLLSS